MPFLKHGSLKFGLTDGKKSVLFTYSSHAHAWQKQLEGFPLLQELGWGEGKQPEAEKWK